jgi:hypothetical protein
VSGELDIAIGHGQTNEIRACSGDFSGKLFRVRQRTPRNRSFTEIHEVLADAEVFLYIKTTPETDKT